MAEKTGNGGGPKPVSSRARTGLAVEDIKQGVQIICNVSLSHNIHSIANCRW